MNFKPLRNQRACVSNLKHWCHPAVKRLQFVAMRSSLKCLVSHETRARHYFLSRCLNANTLCQLQRVAVFGCSQRREWVSVAKNEEHNLLTEKGGVHSCFQRASVSKVVLCECKETKSPLARFLRISSCLDLGCSPFVCCFFSFPRKTDVSYPQAHAERVHTLQISR